MNASRFITAVAIIGGFLSASAGANAQGTNSQSSSITFNTATSAATVGSADNGGSIWIGDPKFAAWLATAARDTAQTGLNGSIWIGDSKFAAWIATAATSTSSPYEDGSFEKLNLSVLGDIIWVPRTSSAQLPARAEPVNAPNRL